MDIDAFSSLRELRWRRLRELTGNRRLTGAEADELTRLYQSTAGDLAAVRSSAPEPGLIQWLSVQLTNARVWLTGAHGFSLADARRYLTRDVPASLYRVRWWSLGVVLAVVALSVIVAVYTLHHPESLALVGTPEERAQIAHEEFASYYTEYDSTSFTARVWTNNAWLAIQCIIFGILGFLPALLLWNTVLQLGVAAAIMAEAGQLDIFFQLIIPHGLLELSAAFVAAAAGMRMCWTALVPGGRSRGQALAEEGRAAIGLAGGLTIALFVSGLIEGYITGSHLPWWLKIAIGSVAFLAFWTYGIVVGRAAATAGATGDTEGDFAVATAAVAA